MGRRLRYNSLLSAIRVDVVAIRGATTQVDVLVVVLSGRGGPHAELIGLIRPHTVLEKVRIADEWITRGSLIVIEDTWLLVDF